MKGTCNLDNIIAVFEKMLRKCCVYIIKGMVIVMKVTYNLYNIVAVT